MTENNSPKENPSSSTSFGETPQGNLAAEFRELGKSLTNILRTAWESEERVQLQTEIESGLSELGTSLNKAANDFAKTPTGQRLKGDVQDFSKRVQSGEVETKIRENMLEVLRTVNAELQKFSTKSSSDKTGDNP
jgi:hypothetical protein